MKERNMQNVINFIGLRFGTTRRGGYVTHPPSKSHKRLTYV